MLEELKLKAKELGIKSVHLYKSEDKLQAKIDEFLSEKEDEKVEEPIVKTEEVKKPNFREEVAKAEIKMSEEPKGDFTYEVKYGKVLIGNFIYRKGDTFKSPKPNLDKRFEVIKI